MSFLKKLWNKISGAEKKAADTRKAALVGKASSGNLGEGERQRLFRERRK